MPNVQRMWRASLQPASPLTREEALEALPCPHSQGEAWLTAQVNPCGATKPVGGRAWAMRSLRIITDFQKSVMILSDRRSASSRLRSPTRRPRGWGNGL